MKKILIYSPNIGGHRHIYMYNIAKTVHQLEDVEVYAAFCGSRDGEKYLHMDSEYIDKLKTLPKIHIVHLSQFDLMSKGIYNMLEETQAAVSPDITVLADGDELLIRMTEQAIIGKTRLIGKTFGLFIRSEFMYVDDFNYYNGFSKEEIQHIYFDFLNKTKILDGYCISDENIVEKSNNPRFYHLPDIPLPAEDTTEMDPSEIRIKENVERFISENKGREIVLLFGDLEKRKGFSFLLKLVKEHDDLILLRVGRTKPGYSVSWDDVFNKETLVKQNRIFEVDCYVSNGFAHYLFSKLKFMLLPYVKFYRTSAVMLDSIKAGIPVVVPDSGLMGYRVEKRGLGTVFRHLNYNDFKAKFNHLRENLSFYQQQINDHAHFVSDENISRELIRILTQDIKTDTETSAGLFFYGDIRFRLKIIYNALFSKGRRNKYKDNMFSFIKLTLLPPVSGIKRRLVIFGSGYHTCTMISIYKMIPFSELVCIIDDSASETAESIGGIDIVKPEKIRNDDFDYIILSTQNMQAKLKDRANQIYGSSVRTVNLYSFFS